MDDKKLLRMMDDVEPAVLNGMELEEAALPEDLLLEAGNIALVRVKEKKLKARQKNGKMGWKSYLAIGVAAVFFAAMMLVSVKAYLPTPSAKTQAQDNSGKSAPGEEMKLSAIADPEFPEKTTYYGADSFKKETLDRSFINQLNDFSSRSASALLGTGHEGENQIFSPLSLYMALAMTANGAEGATRSEILSALSMSDFDMDTINGQTSQLFRNLYFDNDAGHLKLANSLWLDKTVPFKEPFLQTLAKEYYTSSYSVDFTDKIITAQQINQWIAENTGGKLGQDDKTRLNLGDNNENKNDRLIMAILNTVHFYDEWEWHFPTGKTAQNQFHLPDGSIMSCDFMTTVDHTEYFKGENYAITSKELKNGGEMLFILPDQGTAPENLLENPQFIREAIQDYQTKAKGAEVTLKLPKFKYDSTYILNDILSGMGMKKAFIGSEADFSNLADLNILYLSKVQQASYISVDEKGCEATSYTVALPTTGGGEDMVWEKINVTLDRPFIFIITIDGGSPGHLPVFVGVVNNPSE